MILAGKMSDKFSPKLTIPGTMLWQVLVMIMYCFCSDPTSWFAYFCCIPMAGSTMMIIVTLQSYIAKRTPKMVRGTIYAVIGMIGSLGTIIYI